MKVYLTGGTGFLGSHIAEALKAAGLQVTALVRSTSDTAFLQELGVELAVGDLGDVASMAAGMHGCDAVVHGASAIGIWYAIDLPDAVPATTATSCPRRSASMAAA